MQQPRSITVSVNPLLKLLGGTNVNVSIAGSSLRLSYQNGEVEEIDIRSIGSTDAVSNGLIFSTFSLRTDKGKRRLKWLSKRQAKKLTRWLRFYFYREITPEVTRDARYVSELLESGYLRSSRASKIQLIAQRHKSISSALPDTDLVEPEVWNYFELLHSIAGWDENEIERRRRQYVAEQAEKYADFFDQVESNPLTKSQREACIVDEDNNLVLAGAGTGKTSAMIGRAGYLVSSGQAQPQKILMLAFANKAAGEMQERLDERLGACGIKASTFHKLGKDIIARVEGSQPSISPLAEDDKLLKKTVDNWFSKHMESAPYRARMLNYFEYFLYPEANPFDFESEGDYFDYILANEIRTLKGEAVKSLGECLLANHLLKLGIEYQYEAAYEHSTRDIDFRQYQPDFYLPEYGIYIEHLGIDRNGKTAPYVDQEEYRRGIEWKRRLHAEHDTCLVETFFYEHLEGSLLESLEQKLQEQGVTFDPLPPEALLDTLKEFGAVSVFSSLLAKLLRQFKANHYDEEKLEEVIGSSANSKQVRAALKLLQPIYKDYQSHLAKSEQIDFDDMIGKALEYVSASRFKSDWKYILVDEFQDISDPRARLVIALRDSVPDSSLFCVGDDWQSIYRFTGSDIHYTTSFENSFGATKVSALDKTFRFNDSICEISSRFVQENPTQVRKQLSTITQVDSPAVSLLRANKDRINDGQPDMRISQVLSRISKISNDDASVYLLARFGFNLPERNQLRVIRDEFPELDISASTMHASKGKEADYVVLLGMEKGKHGFPSQKVTHPLLDALLPGSDEYPYAEERRLFYVALTRTRFRAYLICDMATASEFVVELLDNDYPLELDEFATSLTQKLFQLISCNRCKTGTMVAREGRNGRFFGCSHYPLCDNTENGCTDCGSPMRKEGRFKVCLNQECDSWLPLCPDCGAAMVQRSGKHGQFWGCRNYRGNEENSCSYSENKIVYSPTPVETA
jgi:DNA helicase-4